MLLFYLIVLRFVHVVASLCWVGGSFIYFLFIEPTAKALTPSGMQFVQHLMVKRRFNIFMAVTSTLTVLSGALLVWQDTQGQLLNWMKTGIGLGFMLGSIAGIVMYCVGMFGVKPRADQLAKLGKEIQAVGGPPTPVQGAALHKLDKEMYNLGVAEFVLAALSLTLMATARYMWF